MCKNPQISSTIKIGEYIPCGYSMWTIWGFDHIKKTPTSYRKKDWMEKFCESLKENAANIIGFKKKKNVTANKERFKETRIC